MGKTAMRRSQTTIMLMAMLLLSASAGAQEQPPDADQADLALVKQLGSESYEVREHALNELLRDETLEEERVFALYTLCETEEQRQRLREVAMHHMLRAVVDAIGKEVAAEEQWVGGALGIRTDALTPAQLPELKLSAIRVTKRLPGFPAYETLRQDDLIVAIQGQLLPAFNDGESVRDEFGRVVKGLGMGKKARMTVVRGGERIDINVELTCFAALEEVFPQGSNFSMKPEYETKWQAMLEKMEESSPVKVEPVAVNWEQ